MLTATAMEGFKSFIEKNIAYARYKIGGTYYNAVIHRKERLPDGKVAVYFSIIPQAGSDVTITEVQLFDTNNALWASKAENIEVKSVQEGVLYRFAFDFKEV